MSHFVDRLMFFKKTVDTFSGGHGVVTNEDRNWEDSYRARWQHDKIVRSTHGVNCTGSCSWTKIRRQSAVPELRWAIPSGIRIKSPGLISNSPHSVSMVEYPAN